MYIKSSWSSNLVRDGESSEGVFRKERVILIIKYNFQKSLRRHSVDLYNQIVNKKVRLCF